MRRRDVSAASALAGKPYYGLQSDHEVRLAETCALRKDHGGRRL